MSAIETKIDTVSNALSLAFKLGVVLGSAVLLMYCWRIGYFPQDVSVGDGIVFILLAIAFSGLYSFFIVSLTSLGYVLKYLWLVIKHGWYLLQEHRRNASGAPASTPPQSLAPFGPVFLIFAAFGVFFIVMLSQTHAITALLLTICAVACIFIWGINQNNAKEIIALEQIANKSVDQIKTLKNLRSTRPLGYVILLAVPLLVGGVTGQFLDGVMRLVNVRSEAAIVHIKTPWNKYAQEYGLKGQTSAFGTEYTRFDDASVLFNGFGKNVVVEMKNPNGPVSLVIPSESIFIIKKGQENASAR